jgi:hypothetical protein
VDNRISPIVSGLVNLLRSTRDIVFGTHEEITENVSDLASSFCKYLSEKGEDLVEWLDTENITSLFISDDNLRAIQETTALLQRTTKDFDDVSQIKIWRCLIGWMIV